MDRKKVTLDKIAAHANVSISTVSRVLTGSATVAPAKRAAVLASAVALGYKPNNLPPELSNSQQRVIGIVTQHISTHTYGDIMFGIFDGLRHSDCTYMVVDGGWDAQQEHDAIAALRGRLVDGLIVLGAAAEPSAYKDLGKELPLIIAGRHIPEMEKHCLWVDNEQSGYDVTRYLLEMGHRKIAHVCGTAGQPDACARQQGYERALREDGIEIDSDLIIEGAFTEQSGVLAVEMLLTQRKNFTAIFAANDLMAQGVRLGLHRRGIRVPQDVSIVGYDNQPSAAYMLPPLTTVRQPDYIMGCAAAKNLLRLLDGKPALPQTFSSQMMLRESVAKVVA